MPPNKRDSVRLLDELGMRGFCPAVRNDAVPEWFSKH